MKIIKWQKAVKLYFNDKVDIIEQYDKKILTPNLDMRIPAVIKYKTLVNKPKYRALKFSPINVYARDNFTCQYCYRKLVKVELTLDHIIPKSKGGPSSWTNCVTCCKKCNLRKSNKTPKEANMKLYKEPRQPSHSEAFVLSIKVNTDIVPEIWKTYTTQHMK